MNLEEINSFIKNLSEIILIYSKKIICKKGNINDNHKLTQFLKINQINQFKKRQIKDIFIKTLNLMFINFLNIHSKYYIFFL